MVEGLERVSEVWCLVGFQDQGWPRGPFQLEVALGYGVGLSMGLNWWQPELGSYLLVEGIGLEHEMWTLDALGLDR